MGNAHLFVGARVAEPQVLVVLVALRVAPILHNGHALAAAGGAAHAVGGYQLEFVARDADRFVRFDVAAVPPTGLVGAANGNRADQVDALKINV